MSECVFIIAEAGVNHNGSLDAARHLVDVAVKAGADAVKFQTFRADSLAVEAAPKAEYQKARTEGGQSQKEMLRSLELSADDHRVLFDYCAQHGIMFLSTAFDEESVDLLADDIGIDIMKIPSGEITNAPLLLKVAKKKLPIIVSTGMCALDDVRAALSVLAFGLVCDDNDEAPGEGAFGRALASAAGKRALLDHVSLLHCTTEYPTPLSSVNLRAMDVLADNFGLPVGYSDHTQGIAVSIMAAARGAVIIEKHFTLDRTLPGPDHAASLEPDELKEMVSGIRSVETALGRKEKTPDPVEVKNMDVARKSLVALRPIAKGEAFTPENIGARRPGNGISPMAYWDILGRSAKRGFAAEEMIET